MGEKLSKFPVLVEIEVHRVDSPFGDDSENIIFLTTEALTTGEQPKYLGKLVNNGGMYCHAN